MARSIFAPARPLSLLNGGGELLTTAGTDLKITLADGTSFEVELDEPIKPGEHTLKAKVSMMLKATSLTLSSSLAPQILVVFKSGMILSLKIQSSRRQGTNRSLQYRSI